MPDQRLKTKDRRQKAENSGVRRMGRRRFLVMCGKMALGAIAACVMPIEIGFSKDKKKFVIKIKRFKDSDLYEEHNLTG